MGQGTCPCSDAPLVSVTLVPCPPFASVSIKKKVRPMGGSRPSCFSHWDSYRLVSAGSPQRDSVTYFPVREGRVHPCRVEARIVKSSRLDIQSIDEAVRACIRLRLRLLEHRERNVLCVRDKEALSGQKNTRFCRRQSVVSLQVQSQVSRCRAVSRWGVRIDLWLGQRHDNERLPSAAPHCSRTKYIMY